MKRLLPFLLLAVSFLEIKAATRYVRSDTTTYGTGSGDDWSNAYAGWNSVNWSALAGGDVVYVAGGNYTNWILASQNLGSAGSPVVVKRATTADHGTETGWDSGFDATVTFHPGYISLDRVNFVTIDGVTAGGISIQNLTSANGISIQDTTGSDEPCNEVTVRYVLINGGVGTTDATKGMFLEVTNFLAQYIYMHSFYDDAIRAPLAKDSVFEFITISNKLDSPSDLHGDTVEMIPGNSDQGVNNATFRYCLMDWVGDGFQLSAIGGQPGPAAVTIHNCIFRSNTGGGAAIKSNSSDPVIGPLNIHNNTFLGGNIRLMSQTTSLLTNNIFYGGSTPTYAGTTTHDYNAYTGTNIYSEANGVALNSDDPFVNHAGGNYTPAPGSAIVGTGFDIGAEFSTNYSGGIRVGDWDIGALSFFVPTIVTNAARAERLNWRGF